MGMSYKEIYKFIKILKNPNKIIWMLEMIGRSQKGGQSKLTGAYSSKVKQDAEGIQNMSGVYVRHRYAKFWC